MVDLKRWLMAAPIILVPLQCAYAGMIPTIKVLDGGRGFVARGALLTDDWEDDLYLKTHVRIASDLEYQSLNGRGKPEWLKSAMLAVKKVDGQWVVEIVGGGNPPSNRAWDLLMDVGEKLLLFPVPPVKAGMSVNVNASIEGIVSDKILSGMDRAYALGKGKGLASPQVFAVKKRGDVNVNSIRTSEPSSGDDSSVHYQISAYSPAMKKLILLSDRAVLQQQERKKTGNDFSPPSSSLIKYAEKMTVGGAEDDDINEWEGVHILNDQDEYASEKVLITKNYHPRHKSVLLGIKNLRSVIKKFHQKEHDAGNFVVVKKSESLLLIAARMNNMKRTTVDQRMYALFKLNPYAFTKGNMNNLMAGVRLDMRISKSDMLSREESTKFVDAQYALWKKTRKKKVEVNNENMD